MVLHDNEGSLKPPLETELPQPPSFHVYACLITASFYNDRVFYPLGIEDSCNHQSNSTSGSSSHAHRRRAPIPKSTENTGQLAGLGIKPMYAAYMSANFITYFDSRITPSSLTNRSTSGPGKVQKEQISHSLLSEMQNAIAVVSDSKFACGRSNMKATGPHESQVPRRFAATLLLPRATPGRMAANKNDVMFLDALALISAATDQPCFSVDAQGNPNSETARKGAKPPRSLTDSVRLSVVSGGAAVASFANGIGLSTNDIFCGEDWKRHAIICFSYVSGKNVVHIPCSLEDGNSLTISPVRCARTIQSAALRAQVMSKGELVLPQGFLSTDYINIDEDDDDLAEAAAGSPFIRAQAEHQFEFRRMHLLETVVDVPQETIQTLKIGSNTKRARFVRICSKNTTMDGLRDESQCPGVMFNANEDLMLEYLNRNRLATPPNQWTREWPPYGVGAPIDEERSGNVSILWYRLETKSVGSRLSVFFPRSLMGERVTDVEGSRIFAVVPTLCPIENVFYAQNYILPCTAKSMIPVGALAPRLYQAFASALDEACEFIFNQNVLPSASSADAAAYVPIGNQSEGAADDDGSGGFVAALMGLRIGHPTSTCGDIYTALQNPATSELVASKSFCNLVATGVSKLGAESSLQDLLDTAAVALEEKLSLPRLPSPPLPPPHLPLAGFATDEPERKRSRSPDVVGKPMCMTASLRQDSHASCLSEVSTVHNAGAGSKDFDSLLRHWEDAKNSGRLIAMAGLQKVKLQGFDGEPVIPFPFTINGLEDLLEIIWLANGISYNVYEERSSQSKDGKMLSERIGLPVDPEGVTTRSVFENGFAFAYGAYQDAMCENGHDIVDDIDTFVLFKSHKPSDTAFYTVKKNGGNLALKEVKTDLLMRPLTKLCNVLFVFVASSNEGGAGLPLKTQLNIWRSVP